MWRDPNVWRHKVFVACFMTLTLVVVVATAGVVGAIAVGLLLG